MALEGPILLRWVMVYDYEVDPMDYPGAETVEEMIGIDNMVDPLVMFNDAIEAGIVPGIFPGSMDIFDRVDEIKERASDCIPMTVAGGSMHQLCCDVVDLCAMVDFLYSEFIAMAMESTEPDKQ